MKTYKPSESKGRPLTMDPRDCRPDCFVTRDEKGCLPAK